MTKNEALILLGLNDQFDYEDFTDALEFCLFELKQFFLTKAPIQKLFQSRLQKLNKLIEANNLFNSDKSFSKVYRIDAVFETDFILEVFNCYQNHKLKIKKIIAHSSHPQDLLLGVNSLIDLEKMYAYKWSLKGLEMNEVIVSKEEDPSKLLEGIRAYNLQNGFTFSQLQNNLNNPPEILIKEMKRLSLLSQNY